MADLSSMPRDSFDVDPPVANLSPTKLRTSWKYSQVVGGVLLLAVVCGLGAATVAVPEPAVPEPVPEPVPAAPEPAYTEPDGICDSEKGCSALDVSKFALDGSAAFADGIDGNGRLDITQLVTGQQGFASYSVTFDMYIGAAGYDTTGMALGADGLCMNLGGGPGLGALGALHGRPARVGEDGVNEGVAICFDEYANKKHQHGFFIYYNGKEIYDDLSICGGDNSNSNNVECPPVSLFVTPDTPGYTPNTPSLSEVWHTVAVTIAPGGGGAQVNVKMSTSDRKWIGYEPSEEYHDNGYTASADIVTYDGLADGQAYLSFSARTGAHVNYHSVRNIHAILTQVCQFNVGSMMGHTQFLVVCSDGEGGEEISTCTSDEHCYDKVKGDKFFVFIGKINKNDMSSDGCVKKGPP
jgi:hypothetical protein